ncbi:hypothetical protein Htur_0237 [Haloterrigena turkmenica DSM 5511]|uniref:50S ribosomal protein LX n=1 Tax=Haloterrigena turkmenica (strain ATCC 51198 / DSM 5511 / JCM 9101 / NCIMB 13204 / VKM B-1734 / 4k) TaxID=543526 RepID=D2RU69_HALTV|nr:hypothetical protein [Haloterrigena turkmenica]ADB59138.1 hypothetical protein Htur_0237 [Haloterrigena turkmenica DSM 5511]
MSRFAVTGRVTDYDGFAARETAAVTENESVGRERVLSRLESRCGPKRRQIELEDITQQ